MKHREGRELSIDARAEAMLSEMSAAEKIGQLVMIGIRGTEPDDDSLYMLHQYHIGGIVLFDRNIESKAQIRAFTAELQKRAGERVPLFIAVDQEGGIVTRGEGVLTAPPSAQSIGESGDPALAEGWARKIGEELTSLGINVNFAPAADVGTKDTRSYSALAEDVRNYVLAAAAGYEEAGILCALKHFPGIGKGQTDSHVDRSEIPAALAELEAEDMLPFMAVLRETPHDGCMVMVSHLLYPELDAAHPASQSPYIMTELLRERCGYTGIIITDDVEMGAVSRYDSFRDIGVKSILAGADIVLVCHEYEHETEVYLGLLGAYEDGRLTEKRLDESVRRILKSKLTHLQPPA
ncbi:beta-N-acetylhexosaminidase [Selenomonas sp. TAMA-11512]|nr:beta-N-acetylhexosaminidase [Selenomonas sp. TAMA-11512]